MGGRTADMQHIPHAVRFPVPPTRHSSLSLGLEYALCIAAHALCTSRSNIGTFSGGRRGQDPRYLSAKGVQFTPRWTYSLSCGDDMQKNVLHHSPHCSGVGIREALRALVALRNCVMGGTHSVSFLFFLSRGRVLSTQGCSGLRARLRHSSEHP